jgi:hypothetical protein
VFDRSTAASRVRPQKVFFRVRRGPTLDTLRNEGDFIECSQMHLEQGTYQGKQMISRGVTTLMQSVQSAMPVGRPGGPNYPELGPGGYGLTLEVRGHGGHKHVEQRGVVNGFVSVCRGFRTTRSAWWCWPTVRGPTRFL